MAGIGSGGGFDGSAGNNAGQWVSGSVLQGIVDDASGGGGGSPPSGFAFVADDAGNHLVDDAGSSLITEI